MRKIQLFSLVSCLGAAHFVANAATIDDIIARLAEPQCLEADVRYEVYLPTSADPVVYNINLRTTNRTDSLAPSHYLIDWTLPRGEKVSNGFSSYADGHHFRYRDARLQEYHYADDSRPFTTPDGGVQRRAQFTDLLPAFLAEKLTEIQGDTASQYHFDPTRCTLEGVVRVNGYDAYEYSYRFDPTSMLPLQTDIVYNPAGISEQTVTATYNWQDRPTDCDEPTEDYLLRRYPDIFARFRTSSYRVENLTGTPVPTFTYRTPQGDRVSHTRGESDLGAPVIIAFIDSSTADAERAVEQTHDIASSLPVDVITVYAFRDDRPTPSFDHNRLSGATSLVGKCGITAYPTFVLVDSHGDIVDSVVGMSAEWADTLTQKLFLLK